MPNRSGAPNCNGSKPSTETRSAARDAPQVDVRRPTDGGCSRSSPELEATLAHLDRCDNQIALLTVGTGTEDRGLGAS